MKKPIKIWYKKEPLFICPYIFTLCLSEDQLNIALNDMEIPTGIRKPFPDDAYGLASTQLYRDEETIVVCLSEKGQKQLPENIAVFLVHEAVHIWQHCEHYYGEDEAGAECEAYAIQFLTARLFYLYKHNKSIYMGLK